MKERFLRYLWALRRSHRLHAHVEEASVTNDMCRARQRMYNGEGNGVQCNDFHGANINSGFEIRLESQLQQFLVRPDIPKSCP